MTIAKRRANETVHVLVAEDDDALRALIVNDLRRRRYAVSECNTGMKLLDALAPLLQDGGRVPYDLIITDIRMPGLQGTSVLAGLASSSLAPPFVLMTAFGDDETHALAVRLGAAALIDKPFELDYLYAHVNAAVRARKRA